MAQRVITTLVDDVDGGEATQTVPFGLDGVHYEIDLSDKNADKLREAFDTYLNNGRRVGGRTKAQNGGRAPAGVSVKGHDLSAVRTWARERGLVVSDRGRISSEVMEAYEHRNTQNVKGDPIPGVVIPKPAPAAPFTTAPETPEKAPQEPETGEGEVKAKPTRKRAASKTTTVKRGNL